MFKFTALFLLLSGFSFQAMANEPMEAESAENLASTPCLVRVCRGAITTKSYLYVHKKVDGKWTKWIFRAILTDSNEQEYKDKVAAQCALPLEGSFESEGRCN